MNKAENIREVPAGEVCLDLLYTPVHATSYGLAPESADVSLRRLRRRYPGGESRVFAVTDVTGC